jgi:nucleotide-binding universal stress UspA family protein
MYVSLLVPLDRSPLAEQALPWALSIARRANARMDLVQVHALYALEDPTAGWLPFDPDCDAQRKQDEQLYLDATARWLTSVSPVRVTASVLHGSAVLPETVANSILQRASAGKVDLIVMATHGRGPIDRFFLGSVADELIRRAGVPVLLVRPGETPLRLSPEPLLENVLVPLDGSALAEQALGPALDLACLMEAPCTLLHVVEASDRGGEPVPEVKARAYLADTIRRLGQRPVRVEGLTVMGRGVAEAILRQAQVNDVIALATHGRGGVRRMLLGSVADKVIRGASTPVLVYKPPAP